MLARMLPVVGSIFFVVGSLLFHPRLALASGLYSCAVTCFVVGSALFTATGALALRAAWSAQPRRLVGRSAIALLGGGLYLLGSCAFIPAWDTSEGALGTQIFQAGNLAYLTSSVCGLAAPVRARRPAARERWAHAAYIFGALLFTYGDLLLLDGNGAAASEVWAAGACSFLVGSALPPAPQRHHARASL